MDKAYKPADLGVRKAISARHAQGRIDNWRGAECAWDTVSVKQAARCDAENEPRAWHSLQGTGTHELCVRPCNIGYVYWYFCLAWAIFVCIVCAFVSRVAPKGTL